jgi:DNA-binding NarL/FixJ family response regulator
VARGWDKLGCSYDAALALLDAGDQASLSQALDRLQSLGADAVARLVRRRMRALGMRPARPGPRASTRQHPAGLTAREAQVLDLICAGCTNDDIANHLVVSVRTVDHHVSAVLAKLGVSTRQLAAAEASRRGLVPSAN